MSIFIVTPTASSQVANKFKKERPYSSSLGLSLVACQAANRIYDVCFKALHSLAPVYISELINTYCFSKSLRSNNQLLLDIPQTWSKCKGDQAFAVAAPSVVEWVTTVLKVINIDVHVQAAFKN